jgi:hypothetical protein
VGKDSKTKEKEKIGWGGSITYLLKFGKELHSLIKT